MSIINSPSTILLKIVIYSMLFAIVIPGCSFAYRQQEYRAHINQNDSSGWQMLENCGFEGCYPMVDFLKSNALNMRLDFYKIQNGNLLFVLLRFLDAQEGLEFNPANITAKLNNNNLRVKGLKCSDAIWDLKFLQAHASIDRPIFLQKDDCYLIFIDYQGLTNETVAMDIDNALILHGGKMNIPTIYFKKNPNYK